MRNASSAARSPSGDSVPHAIDPGPITGLVVLSLLGCAMAYHLAQLSKRGVIRTIHPIGFCLCYVCVLAYAGSDAVGSPITFFVQLLGLFAALWFLVWSFATLVLDRFGCCAEDSLERNRDPQDRSIFADDL